MKMLWENCTTKIILLTTMCIVVASFPADREQIYHESSVQSADPAATIAAESIPELSPIAQQRKINRAKREIIFRPLFVYKQEELEKRHFNNKFVLTPQAEKQYQQLALTNYYG
ncbi:uncharacterized protein LOC131694053 [Topomyia yanbarensis]|uniref:uncharacterized protein LOC131694053 n=1 Tax=Topomyia yanbarensis TaxID=2498891 RepID=UPI00273C9F9A|nr:uncharacterized protein LOC131694053 [Topomyia yanbarensis]